jgi:hypothetical protein
MSYEIPQELQYQERIVFGMTLEQMIYATIAAFCILLVMRTRIDMYVRIGLSCILTAVGLLFIFGNLRQRAQDLWFFLRNRQFSRYSKTMRDWSGAVSVEKDHILVQKGKVRVRTAILSIELLCCTIIYSLTTIT